MEAPVAIRTLQPEIPADHITKAVDKAAKTMIITTEETATAANTSVTVQRQAETAPPAGRGLILKLTLHRSLLSQNSSPRPSQKGQICKVRWDYMREMTPITDDADQGVGHAPDQIVLLQRQEEDVKSLEEKESAKLGT